MPVPCRSKLSEGWCADISAFRLEYYVTIAGLFTRTPGIAPSATGSMEGGFLDPALLALPLQGGKGTIGVAVGRPLLSVAEDHHPRDAAADCCHGVVERHCYEATVVDHSRHPGYLQRSSWSSCNTTAPE